MATKNPFSTATYERVFREVLEFNEITNKDECLVRMNEPMGKKISPIQAGHKSAQCMAFITTTTNDRLIVAVFNLYGQFYQHYVMPLSEIRHLEIKKVFAGMNVSFRGMTQHGFATMKMYIPKREFGTDLKQQKEHMERLISNLNNR